MRFRRRLPKLHFNLANLVPIARGRGVLGHLFLLFVAYAGHFLLFGLRMRFG